MGLGGGEGWGDGEGWGERTENYLNNNKKIKKNKCHSSTL